MQRLGNFNKIVYRRLQSLLTKFRTELLYCTVQGILYKMLPEPNWLVPGDRSYLSHSGLDHCGALNLGVDSLCRTVNGPAHFPDQQCVVQRGEQQTSVAYSGDNKLL